MAKTAPIIPFDVEEQKTRATELVASFNLATLQIATRDLVIHDDETYQAAIDLRNQFARAEKKIMDFFDPLAKAANALHKMLTKARGEVAAPYAEGKRILTEKAETYLIEQKRAKREAEAKLAKVADRQQGELLKKAEDLEMRGYMTEADQLRQQAVMTVAPTLPEAIPQAEGARVGDKFKGRVEDLIAVMKSIVEGETPLMWEVKPGDERPLVVVDQVVLNAIVSRLQLSLRIPGITVEEGVRIASAKL